MHDVICQPLCPNWLERAGPDVQRDKCGLNSRLVQAGQHGFVEMQACCGGGDSTRMVCVYRLVSLLVFLAGDMSDVRRQRRGTVLIQNIQYRLAEVQAEQFAFTSRDSDVNICMVAQLQGRIWPGGLAAAYVGQGGLFSGNAFDQHLDLPSCCFLACQSGLDHTGIIEDQQVAALQNIREIGKLTVMQHAVAVKVQQAAGCSGCGRMLCNQLGRKVVIELGKDEFGVHERIRFIMCGSENSDKPLDVRRIILLLGIVALLLRSAMTVAQVIPSELQQAWRSTGLPESSVSLYVQEVGGGPLISLNASEPRNPASVMKMVTTWAGLLALGPEHTWRTAMLADHGIRLDDEGTLAGPLYIKAAGDPFLSVQDLWSLLRELRLRGVKNLSEVIVDRSIFGAVTIDPAAFDGAFDRPYNASPDAMMVGLGAVRLLFYPDVRGQKWVPVIDPPVRGVRVTGEVGWRGGTCPGSPRVSTQLSTSGPDAVIQVSGEVVGSCGAFSTYRLAQSQEQFFKGVFRMLWRELGGTLARDIRSGRAPASAQMIAWHDSDSLANVIRRINKQSNNVMARLLLLHVGVSMHGSGATPHSAASAALTVLRDADVDTRGWVIDNGSGLSRTERLTASGLAGMLDGAWHSSLVGEFMSSLAISGVDGTVRRRLRNSDARGMAHLKTGTLRDSRALAGYVLGASGKRYILVSMANHGNAVAIRPFEDALVNWLAAR